MRLLCFLTAVVLLISMTACQTGKSSTEKQIAKSLDEINKKLSTLNKELGAIKKELVKPETKPLPKKPVKRVVRKGPDFRRLRKIKLAENPSRKQVEEYFKKIMDASKGQNTFGSNDPQIAMLSKIGPQNIDLLINNIKHNNYVYWALPNVAAEQNKKQILEAFKTNHQLINCIVKKRWGKDAKKTILNYLKNNNKITGHRPEIWAAAAVQVASPEDYGIIEDFFANAGNPEMMFSILMQLDGFDMKKAANKGWAKKKSQRKTYSKGNMAVIAAKLGNKDAFKYMVYACEKEKNQYLARKMMTALFQLTGKSLSPKAMERWYKENEKNLVFDPENEEYIIKAKPEEKNLRNP